jgi:hypothetical protein
MIVYLSVITVKVVSGAEVVPIGDAQTSIGDRVEHLIEENVVIVEERTEEEIEDQIVAHVEVAFKIAHVVQSFDEIELT